MQNPLDKISGLNEDPNVLSGIAPEEIRKKLHVFADGEDKNEAKSAEDIFATLVRRNKKMGKMDNQRAAECTKEIQAVLKKLKDKKASNTALDEEDYMAFATQITVLYASTVAGKIMLDPALSELLASDQNLAKALEASLVGMSVKSKISVGLQRVGNIFCIAFSLGGSAWGIRSGIADAIEASQFSNPEHAFESTMAVSGALALFMAKVLYDFKKDVNKNMESAPQYPEGEWTEKPKRTAIKHHGRTIIHGVRGGARDFVHDRPWIRNSLFAGLLLAGVQAVDGATNGMMVGDLSLGTTDKSHQVASAIAQLDERAASLDTQMQAVKAKTTQAVQTSINGKLTQERIGKSETGAGKEGPVYYAKDFLWNENPAAQAWLTSHNDLSRGEFQVVSDSGLVEGHPMAAEVEGIFNSNEKKLQARITKIKAIEDGISNFAPAELIQVQLNEMVAELGAAMEETNQQTQDEVSAKIASYKAANSAIVGYAMSNGGEVYKNAVPGAIEGIQVDEFKVDNPPITLEVENRSTLTLLNTMGKEMGWSVTALVAAILLVAGLTPTNLELLTLAPVNARTANKKRGEVEKRKIEIFEPAIETIVSVLEQLLNKGSASKLLHTKRIDRQQIKEAVLAFLNEETEEAGLLSKLVNFREVLDHDARVAVAQELTGKGPKIMMALLERILPGIGALMGLEDKQVSEATRINDEHIVDQRKRLEAIRVSRADGPVNKTDLLLLEEDPEAYMTVATKLLSELEEELEQPWEYEESKNQIKNALKNLLEGIGRFIDDEENLIMNACSEEEGAQRIMGLLKNLQEATKTHTDTLKEAGCTEAQINTIVTKLAEKIKAVMLRPYLKHVDEFTAPILKGSAVEAARTYATAMESLMSHIPASLTDEDKVTIQNAVVAATKDFLTSAVNYIASALKPTSEIGTLTVKQVTTAQRNIETFETEMASNAFAAALYPAATQTAVQAIKGQLAARSGALEQEAKELILTELKNFEFSDTSATNTNNLLNIVLGHDTACLALEENGVVVVKIDKREKDRFGKVLTALINELEEQQKVSIKAFADQMTTEEIANGARPLLQADCDDLEVGLARDDHFEAGTDLYGNGTLVASDHGVNDRQQNQDSVGMNLKTCATILVDGMGGEGGPLAGGKFSELMTKLFVADPNTGTSLEGALDNTTTQVRSDLNGQVLPQAGGVVAAIQITNNGKQLDTAYVGDARILLIGANGTVKWKNEQQGVGSTVTNAVQMDGKPINWETGSHILEPGDRILLCSDGILRDGAAENEIVTLATQVDVHDDASVRKFLNAIEGLTNNIGDNRSLSLTVVD